MQLDAKITKFLSSQHLCAIAVKNGDSLHSFSAFYAFDEKCVSLIFASKDESLHTKLFKLSSLASAIVALNTMVVAKVEGVQILGEIEVASESLKELYFKKFAYAKAVKSEVYSLKILELKYTNNTLGFGKKITWSRQK